MASRGNNIAPLPKDDRGITSTDGLETLGRLPERSTDDRLHSYSRHEPYVDAKEGAAFLRMHPKTLMRLARDGAVPAYSFTEGTRRHWRFLISELDKWMKTKVNSNADPVTFVSPGRRK
jgi:Helix-turn-helix domain